MLRRVCDLWQDTGANVALIGALALPLLFGLGALAFDLNRTLTQIVKNQAIADSAALAAATAYKAASQNAAVLPLTAQDLGVANGLASSNVSATLLSNYPTTGASAVKVVVSSTVPVSFARALGWSSGLTVTSTAYASLTGNTGFNPCFLALSPNTSALVTTGGGSIHVSGCDVAAIGEVSDLGAGISADSIVSASSDIYNLWGPLTAKLIQYATSYQNWYGTVTATKITQGRATLTDPWASNTTLIADRALLGTYTTPQTIANPKTSGGSDWNFNWSPDAKISKYQTAPYSGVYVVPAGNYSIGQLQVAGGVTVTFAPGSTITVANGLYLWGGANVNFGASNLAVNGGFYDYSGFTMGNGALSIGSGIAYFSGTNTIGTGPVAINADTTLNGGSSITMGVGNHAFRSLTIYSGSWIKLGAGDLDVTGLTTIYSNSTLALGAGNYRLGAGVSGDSLDLYSSAVMIMGDGTFSAAGNIMTQGGSRLVFGATTNHLINGNLSVGGGVLFGAGAYTIDGSLYNGTGGTTWPYYDPVTAQTYGSSLSGTATSGYDMIGVNVTFLLSGTVNLGGGAHSLLISPSASVSGGVIQDLLIDSLSSLPTTWGGGSVNNLAGSVHLPNSAVSLTDGATTLGSGQCFMLIANTIAVLGGAATGSVCPSVAGSGSSGSSASTIKLIG